MSIDLKHRALDLANAHTGESAENVVHRARVYHTFLSDAPNMGAVNPNPASKATTATTTATKADKADKPVTEKATKADKPDKAPDPSPNPKANGATNPKAAASKDNKATGEAVAGDTKGPDGTHTYNDVVAALRRVQECKLYGTKEQAREKAFEIMAAKGSGAKSVRDLKPALYDAVVKGCDAALKPAKPAEDPLGDPPERTGGGHDADPAFDIDGLTGQPERDEFGNAS